ncbi:MAG: hypothetical protein RIR62_1226 [Pseudomonadota bacterium]
MGLMTAWGLFGQMLVSATVLAAAGFWAVQFARTRGAGREDTLFAQDRGVAVFLFDGNRLIDCTPEGRALLAGTRGPDGGPADDWLSLMGWLGLVFPGICQRIDRLGAEGRFILNSPPDAVKPLVLSAELRAGITRLELRDADHAAQPAAAAGLLAEEVDLLRRMAALSPALMWRETAEGAVVWANAAYLLCAAERLEAGAKLGWPLPRLFDPAPDVTVPQRLSLTGAGAEGGAARWFDVALRADGDGRFGFAAGADAAVRAETASRDFLQAMAKAFIHVPIGMAVFDRQRHLQMFNPAMTDLTGLPTDFLIARPTLLAILDAMRDRNMLPEPRDYRSWRRHLAEMEDAGTSPAHYEETWMLPGGQSYRVIGRPQPDGWLVLMIEDISTEVTRSQRYRTDIEMGQAVIDTLDEAIAVFSPSGALVMSNAAYVALWQHDPAATLGSAAIAEVAAHWRALSAPSAVWSRIEDFAARLGLRDGWSEEVRLSDGRLVTARVAALSGGATLAAFRVATPAAAPLQGMTGGRKRA